MRAVRAGPGAVAPRRNPLRAVLRVLALCALWLGAELGCARARAGGPYRTWEVAGGDAGVSRYSELTQIHRGNVQGLRVAWTYRSGDSWDGSTIQANPIVVDGILYTTTPSLHAVALDAATGQELWRFDPFDGQRGTGTNRGVSFWQDEDDARILFSAGPHLYALDASTGEPMVDFGEAGVVDLRYGLSRDAGSISVASPAPGVIYDDLIIMGSMGNSPGHVRAYDVRSGALIWTFHTIPHPGEPFHDTWEGDAWRTAEGANVWGGLSVDSRRGMVYFATGSPKPNFLGWLHKGRNLYANSVVALRAATGEYVWHFQEIRHDIWDLDLPAAPNLVTVRRDGQVIEAVASLLDRDSGEPLFPVREYPVPASPIPIESAWPTQPRPDRPPPFARQELTEADLTVLSPEARSQAMQRFREAEAGWFQPVGPRGAIFYGIHGGAEWGGASFDPSTGILYVNANNVPWIITLEEIRPDSNGATTSPAMIGGDLYQRNCVVCHGPGGAGTAAAPAIHGLPESRSAAEIAAVIMQGRGQMPSFGHISAEEVGALLAYLGTSDSRSPSGDGAEPSPGSPPDYRFTGFKRFLDDDGYPAVKPPWGTLSAIDLNLGEIVWQVPLGEHQELSERGHPQTGTENFGGSMVTAGGLVFIAATKDQKFRAFDAASGRVLWEATLPAGGYATPATYEIDGRQFVVIAAGGGGKLGTMSGDYYVAFALEDRPDSTMEN